MSKIYINGKNHKMFRGCGEIPLSYFLRLKNNAIIRNKEFNITIEDISNIFDNQEGQCLFTKEKLIFYSQRQNKKGFETTASLDRINNEIGYVLGNIRWIHKNINKIKGTKTDKELIKICKEIINYQKIKNDIIFSDYKLIRLISHKDWKGYGDLSSSHFSSIKHDAKRRNIDFNIKISDIWKLVLKQKGHCFISGRKLNFCNFRDSINYNPSLDRIDVNQNYTLNNVIWTDKEINMMRKDINFDEFLINCKKISCMV